MRHFRDDVVYFSVDLQRLDEHHVCRRRLKRGSYKLVIHGIWH